MMLTNPPKALIVIISLMCLTLLLALQRLEPVAGAGMMGTIIGYAVGNGIAAKSGEPVEPIVGPRTEPE